MFIVSTLIATAILCFLFRPIAEKLFTEFADKGWGFLPGLSIALVSFVSWWLNQLPFVKLSFPIVAIVLIGFAILFVRRFGKTSMLKNWHWDSPKVFITLLWLSFFSSYLYIRTYAANIFGIEKFPDHMILNSIYSHGQVPPPNLFASEQVINYYYFGHYMAAVLAKLSGTPASWMFHLFTGFVVASGASAIASLSMGLIKASDFLEHLEEKKKNSIYIFTGFFTALFAFFLGNFHSFYKLVILGQSNFWYPEATRYIQNTIHEFPYYSILIGDMHAHLLNWPNMIFTIALSYLLLSRIRNFDLSKWGFFYFLSENKLLLGLLAIAFGTSFISNSWDIMTTMLFAGLCSWVALSLNQSAWSLRTLKFLVLLSSFFVIGAIISYLPFWISFDPPSKGLAVVPELKSSPMIQLIVIWLVHATIPILFLLGRNYFKGQNKNQESGFAFIKSICILGFLLIFFLEFFYFKDIYLGHIRANSMFKIGLFVWILFSIATVCTLTVAVFGNFMPRSWKTAYLLIFTFLFNAGILYSIKAIEQYVGVEKHNAGSLEGMDFIAKKHPDRAKAIDWILENTKLNDIVLTTPEGSFSEGGLINIFTGRATVLTWDAHIWLWHHTRHEDMKPQTGLSKRLEVTDSVDNRLKDIKTIYMNKNPTETFELLQRYGIDYVVIDEKTLSQYRTMGLGQWADHFSLAFSSGILKIYKTAKMKTN